MNALVYPVDGGMEDWAYAAAWDRDNVVDCKGYSPHTSTNKNDVIGRSARCAVFLVETSDRKKPHANSLGSSRQILQPNGSGNGHIARNVRLSLAAIDIAEPYVCISSVNVTRNAAGSDVIVIRWTVHGALVVDATWLALHADPGAGAALPKSLERPVLMLKDSTGQKGQFLGNISAVQSGRASSLLLGSMGQQKQFSAVITADSINSLLKGRQLRAVKMVIVGWAAVDSRWGLLDQGRPRGMGPQTLLAQTRVPVDGNIPLWSSHPIFFSLTTMNTVEIDCVTLSCTSPARFQPTHLRSSQVVNLTSFVDLTAPVSSAPSLQWLWILPLLVIILVPFALSRRRLLISLQL